MCSGGHRFTGEQRFDGVARFVLGHEFFALAAVDASLVAEDALVVEDESVRGRGRPVLERDRLGGAIGEIREVEVAILGADPHFGEGIADVGVSHFAVADGVRVVGIDGDHGYAAIAVIGGKLLDALLIHLRDGAVIAGEDQDQHFAGAVFGQVVELAVDAGQVEIGRGRTDAQDGGRSRGRMRHFVLRANGGAGQGESETECDFVPCEHVASW